MSMRFRDHEKRLVAMVMGSIFGLVDHFDGGGDFTA